MGKCNAEFVANGDENVSRFAAYLVSDMDRDSFGGYGAYEVEFVAKCAVGYVGGADTILGASQAEDRCYY